MQRWSLPERGLQVLSDLWHITTDHPCGKQSPGPAQLQPLQTWLHTAELLDLQPLLSRLANEIEPLLVLTNVPSQEASVSLDEAAD